MPRLPLVPLLLAAVALLGMPAEAAASCNGATRMLKREICPPDARFTASETQVLPGGTVTLDASGSSVMLPRTIVQYAWDLDGVNGYEEIHAAGDPLTSVTFAPDFRGQRDIGLRVTDSEGLTDYWHVTISVSTPPVAQLQVSDITPLSLTDVTLDASASSDPDGAPLQSFAYDLDGDDVFETDGGATTTVQFPAAGTREVQVKVTDADEATATASVFVYVENRAPTAAVSVPAVALAGKPTTVSAAASADADGSVTHYAWDLDGLDGYEVDGGTSPTLTRTWPASGSHPVGVEVTDNLGDKATAATTIVVKTAPTAALTATPQQPLPGDGVTLDASGSSDLDGPLASYAWDLDGDGVFERTTGTTSSTTTTFPAAGIVTVRVRVADGDGLTATASATVTIKQPAGSGGVDAGTPTGGDSGTVTGGGGATTTPTPATPAPAAGTDTKTTGGGATGGGASPGATPRAGGTGPGATAGRGVVATLDGKTIQSLRTILKSGMRLACRGVASTRCAIRIEVDKATAKRLRLGRSTLLASMSLRVQGAGTTAVKLSAKASRALARTRSVRLIVKGTATAADGTKATISRVVLARR